MQTKHSTEKHSILVVDDSLPTLEVIRRNLNDAGYHVQTASCVEDALRVIQHTNVDLVITDLKMPGKSGMDLIRHVRERYEDVEVMLVTGYPSISDAVQAVKGGAEDYLVKPFTDRELLVSVQRVLEKLDCRRKAHQLPFMRNSFGIIGESPAMQTVFHLIERAAESAMTVLISGESGTGKELVARGIHYNSDRRTAPFVPVNCTAIPENLLESELFGHVKGAFTGAHEARSGFFQIADGGTLFLDEIGDASSSLQSKLLRVLQSKEIFMVGSSRVQTVNTRILAATHKNLPELVKAGKFREDLFYRLNVVEICVPPVRDRGDDWLLLLNFIIGKHTRENGRQPPRFSDEALQRLRIYDWPGNVREMENLVTRLIFLVENDVIGPQHLPAVMRETGLHHMGFQRTLAEVEAEHIRNVLDSVDGSKIRAAGILGIDRKTLREKLKRLCSGSYTNHV